MGQGSPTEFNIIFRNVISHMAKYDKKKQRQKCVIIENLNSLDKDHQFGSFGRVVAWLEVWKNAREKPVRNLFFNGRFKFFEQR